MNTPNRTPDTRASKESIAKGFNQLMLGSTDVGGAVPKATLASATTAKRTSVMTSAPSSPTCVLADSSMPIVVIAVMIAIQTMPTAVTATVESAALCQSTSRNE